MLTKNPHDTFQQWHQEAMQDSPLSQKGFVCVSTIDQNNYPDGRFVDLKAFSEQGFTFCTHLDSAKGQAISSNPKVALTFWWEHVNKQVRIKGDASQISEAQADIYWKTRKRSAQITTTACHQSQPLNPQSTLAEQVSSVTAQCEGIDVPRPTNWGGYIVKPVQIEFLTFEASRLHGREQFTLVEDQWQSQRLQP